MASAAKMKPGSGGGPVQNAKAQPKQRQSYGKGAPVAQKYPAKKSGTSGDNARSRKGSPFAPKKK